MCKADYYEGKAELETSERANEESIELVVSNSSCSSAVDMRGFDNAYHHYTLVISARLNTVASRLSRFKFLMRAAAAAAAGRRRCGVECQLKTVAKKIINESRPIIDKSVAAAATATAVMRS